MIRRVSFGVGSPGNPKRQRGTESKLIVARVRFVELRSWCRPDRANAAIAGTSDASRNVVDSVISATQLEAFVLFWHVSRHRSGLQLLGFW